ncbi:MAG: AAA family ATPase, partial [Terracoccus sp.]
MTGGVVGEKVRRPEPGGLCRPRLEQRLIGSPRAGVALVVAPPGSGKTTLLAQVAALPGRRSAWYCVGPEDGTESGFVRHLAHALACVTSVVDPLTESIDELLIALHGATLPLLLVTDDLHEISGSPAEAVLERFVRLR